MLATKHAKKGNGPLVVAVALLCCCALVIGGVGYMWWRSSQSAVANIDSLQAEIVALQTELAEKGAALEAAQQEIEKAADAAVSGMNDRLAEKQAALDKLTEQLAALQAQLAETRKALEAAESREAALRKEMATAYPADAKLIALTFDDGPSTYTAELLDFIEQRGVKATFFVIGKNVEKYGSVLPRIVAAGCEIGNHSYAHKSYKGMTAAEMAADYQKCNSLIAARVKGYVPAVMRPPGGNYNAAVQSYFKSQGVGIVNWCVDTRDWESRNVDSILKNAYRTDGYGIRENAVVLMHDIYPTTVEAAKILIDRLLSEGYTLCTVSELLANRAGGMKAGSVYYAADRVTAIG